MKKISFGIVLCCFCLITDVSSQSLSDGLRYTRNEEYENAEKVFSNLILKKPNFGDYYYYAGLNYLAKGDSLKAVQMFNDGLAKAPNSAINLVGKGHLQLRRHNVQSAETFFILAAATKKKLRPLINKEIARAYLLVEFGTPTQLKTYAVRAMDYIKLSTNDFESKILLGDAMVISNPSNSSEAIQQYIIASYDGPDDPRPLVRQAKVYSRASAYALAITKLEEALFVDVNFAPAYRQKAEVFSLMKERDSAVYYYQEYLRRNNNLSARKFFVQSLYLNGDFDLCIVEGNKLLAERQIPNVYGVIAYAIAEKEKVNKSLVDSALQYYFSNYEALYVQAQGRELLGSENYIKAILMFKSGIASGNDTIKSMMSFASFGLLRPVLEDTSRTNIKLYQRVQDMYFNAKSYQQAYGVLELKRKKQSGILNSRDLYYEGRCLASMNMNPEALKIYSQIIANDSNYISGYYLIATTWNAIDPIDSSGNVSRAFERWIGKLDSLQQIKFAIDIENAYRNMAYFAQKKKDYEKTSYYYGKVLETSPTDQAIIDIKMRWDDYLLKVKARENKSKTGVKSPVPTEVLGT